MSLPFNLQKLPAEALTLLRYLGQVSAASAEELETGTGLGNRTVGRAIRRLVTADYIFLAPTDAYQLTSDGQIAVEQIAEYDRQTQGTAPAPRHSGPLSPVPAPTPASAVAAAPAASVQRRLTAVLPRRLIAGRATDVFIGINPPANSGPLPVATQIELKLSAVGATVSPARLMLEVPPDKAAIPARFNLTPAQPGRAVRVRVDAFQNLDADHLEPLGGMYFDAPVDRESTPSAAETRAVGMDIMLKPPR